MTSRRYPASGPLTLKANIGRYGTTRALLDGEVTSTLVAFDFAGLRLAHMGFQDMLRRDAFDVSEMAIATFLQVREFGKPFTLLPITVLARFQQHCIHYNADRGVLSPGDLPGRRVAVRSYTQTTGLWVRGILQDDYGIDPDSVIWVCSDDPHLEDYSDPPSVVRAPEGSDPARMLLDGEVDAAILGLNTPDDPRLRPLIPDPAAEASGWYARHRLVPPNHMIIVPDALVAERPDAVREVFTLLVASRNADAAARGGAPDGIEPSDHAPVGVEANRKSLELAIHYALQQGVIHEPVTVDDLFPPFVHVLRSAAPPASAQPDRWCGSRGGHQAERPDGRAQSEKS